LVEGGSFNIGLPVRRLAMRICLTSGFFFDTYRALCYLISGGSNADAGKAWFLP